MRELRRRMMAFPPQLSGPFRQFSGLIESSSQQRQPGPDLERAPAGERLSQLIGVARLHSNRDLGLIDLTQLDEGIDPPCVTPLRDRRAACFVRQTEGQVRQLQPLVNAIRTGCGHLARMDSGENHIRVDCALREPHRLATGLLGSSFIGGITCLHQRHRQLAENLDPQGCVLRGPPHRVRAQALDLEARELWRERDRVRERPPHTPAQTMRACPPHVRIQGPCHAVTCPPPKPRRSDTQAAPQADLSSPWSTPPEHVRCGHGACFDERSADCGRRCRERGHARRRSHRRRGSQPLW